MILATCMLINLKHEYSVFSIYRYTPTKRKILKVFINAMFTKTQHQINTHYWEA